MGKGNGIGVLLILYFLFLGNTAFLAVHRSEIYILSCVFRGNFTFGVSEFLFWGSFAQKYERFGESQVQLGKGVVSPNCIGVAEKYRGFAK